MIKVIFKCICSAIIICSTFSLKAQDGQGSPGVSQPVKTFALNPDKPSTGANSVNLFTGDVSLPLNLISLPGRNGLSINVGISYSSNVQNSVGRWNVQSPTGILGLGWLMDFPKIICDDKQTGAREDDTYYIIEGGSSNELVCTTISEPGTSAYKLYELRNYKFWKIKYYIASERWEIIKEDGTTYVYGDINSSRNTIQWAVRWGNWIGNSSIIRGQSRMASAWNMSEVVSRWGDKVTYEYLSQESMVGVGGLYHTEASYIKKIIDMFGRKVEFSYLDKSTFVFNGKTSKYYMQPHDDTGDENITPDAYQEHYEKFYLDKIIVSKEDGSLFFNVEFGYSSIDEGTNTAKMLLSSIIQRNSSGNALPGMSFSYNLNNDILKGFLNTVTYPAGGRVIYDYERNGLSLGLSKKDFTAIPPAGYYEPMIFMEENYVVVTWRKLNNDGSSDAGPKDVILKVYEWAGEWKELNLGSIGTVELNYPYDNQTNGSYQKYGYKDFQVSLQKNFFSILRKDASGSYLWIFQKDEILKGNWYDLTLPDLYPSSDTYTLGSGENFVFVGSKSASTNNSISIYTFQGNKWKRDFLNPPCGEHYYTGTNNYFLDQNKFICNNLPNGPCVNPELRFNYLMEDKTWKNILQCGVNPFSSYDFERISWQPSNSFAVALLGNNPGYIYSWDNNYNLTRDNNSLGTWPADCYINIINNNLIGVSSRSEFSPGRTTRFNGGYWTFGTDITPAYKDMISFSDDGILWKEGYGIDDPGFLRYYSPNSNSWVNMTINAPVKATQLFSHGSLPLSIGSNIATLNNKVLLKGTDDKWLIKYNLQDLPHVNEFLTAFDPGISWGELFRVDVNYFYYGYLQFIKNGELGNNVKLSPSFKWRSNGETIYSLNSTTIITEGSTGLNFNRIINEEINGNQLDYPVTRVEEIDGSNFTTTYIGYDNSTATYDISGSVARYNKVIVSNSGYPLLKNSDGIGYDPLSIPNGYTENYFNNGLSFNNINETLEYAFKYGLINQKQIGLQYKTKVFDNKNSLVASTEILNESFSRPINNNLGDQIDIGYYVRPTEVLNITDGINYDQKNFYNYDTGMVYKTIQNKHDSKEEYYPKGPDLTITFDHTLETYYTYFWEKYDPSNNFNILSPVIQTKSVFSSFPLTVKAVVNATTWKTWGPNNTWAPHKSYTSKNTEDSNFDFTNWSGTGEPATYWIKVSEVNSMDSKGNISQITTR